MIAHIDKAVEAREILRGRRRLHQKLRDEFMGIFVAQVRTLEVGDPTDSSRRAPRTPT